MSLTPKTLKSHQIEWKGTCLCPKPVQKRQIKFAVERRFYVAAWPICDSYSYNG